MAKMLVEEVEVEDSGERKEWQCQKCGATVVAVAPPVAGADCPVCVAVKAGKHTASALWPLGKEMGIKSFEGKPGIQG